MIIRKATGRDNKEICKLLNEYSEYESLVDKKQDLEPLKQVIHQIKYYLNQKNFIFLVAEKNKELIAVIFSDIRKRGKEAVCVLHQITVKKSERRKGVGKKLFRELQKILKEKNCNYIRSFILPKNKKSLEFWKKQGFSYRLGYTIKKRLK